MPKIKEIYAFIAEDSPNDEGVAAFYKNGQWFPMVAGDKARLDSFRPIAKQISKQTGKKIKLVKFSTREVLEEIK